MDFNKYRRLKKAVLQSKTVEGFIIRVGGSAHWFGIPLWSKENYRWFYEKVKGGARYADLIETN